MCLRAYADSEGPHQSAHLCPGSVYSDPGISSLAKDSYNFNIPLNPEELGHCTDTLANSVDPDEMAHNEPPH